MIFRRFLEEVPKKIKKSFSKCTKFTKTKAVIGAEGGT